MWSALAVKTIQVPIGESALSRIFAAINAVDPRLEYFALHVFEAQTTEPKPLWPFPGSGPTPANVHRYFLTGQSGALNAGALLSASFNSDKSEASDSIFGALVVYTPKGREKPFRCAPDQVSVGAVVAIQNKVHLLPLAITCVLASSVPEPTAACPQLRPVEFEHIVPYIAEPRWSLDRLPDGHHSLGEPSPDALQLVSDLKCHGLELPALSDEILRGSDLGMMQRVVFEAYGRWVNDGQVIHQYFGGPSFCTRPIRAAKIARHPTIRHWLDHALAFRNPVLENRPWWLCRNAGDERPDDAIQPEKLQARMHELTHIRTDVERQLCTYVRDVFFREPCVIENELYAAVDDLLHNRGLAAALLTTIADTPCDAAYEFGNLR